MVFKNIYRNQDYVLMWVFYFDVDTVLNQAYKKGKNY